jgi:hypothetical protein
MRSHDAIHIVVHEPTLAVDELRSFWADLPQHGEVWIERVDGTSVCALQSTDRAWLMYLRHDGDAGFSTRNPHYVGPPNATLEFVLTNNQRDLYPAAWTYPVADVLHALERFARDGVFPRENAWHNDAEDGSAPPIEPHES